MLIKKICSIVSLLRVISLIAILSHLVVPNEMVFWAGVATLLLFTLLLLELRIIDLEYTTQKLDELFFLKMLHSVLLSKKAKEDGKSSDKD